MSASATNGTVRRVSGGRVSAQTKWIVAMWVALVGGYAVVGLVMPAGHALTAYGDLMQCMVPLVANAGLLLNTGSADWRKNTFWMLLAIGCTLWMVSQLLWTHYELVLKAPVPNPFVGDVIVFLHIVPMIAALALQPHRKQSDRNLKFGFLDFTLLLLWWVYLYFYVVIPWQYVAPNEAQYTFSYIELYALENLMLLAGLGWMALKTRGAWRTIYVHLFGAAFLYAFSSQVINVAIAKDVYYTGSLWDVPLMASFVWFGTAGMMAWRSAPEGEAVAPGERWKQAWPTWMAMAAVLSIPAMGAWSMYLSDAPPKVKEFRVVATLAGIVPLAFLVFLRQHLLDRDRLKLLAASQSSIDSLKRLQTQLVQSEKLASLGQLAAGAAHEINNPLTAILGYSEVLIEDSMIGPQQRGVAERLREQARRTKMLVTNLLSFARQMPAEKTLLDITAVLGSAVQLRQLDLKGKSIRMQVQNEGLLPAVRGDANQLLQVFFNIVSNAVDAMEDAGGGVLTLKTFRDGGNVVIEFTDTGAGIKEPSLVFDPFYTTKPVGRGTGLGLSICYGIVQEHGGQITCCNRPEGGATFRVELPAVMAVFPKIGVKRSGVVEAVVSGVSSEE